MNMEGSIGLVDRGMMGLERIGGTVEVGKDEKIMEEEVNMEGILAMHCSPPTTSTFCTSSSPFLHAFYFLGSHEEGWAAYDRRILF